MSNAKHWSDPYIKEIKTDLRKKRISWKAALAVFGLDEIHMWIRKGNCTDRIAEAISTRVKQQKKRERDELV